MPSPERVSQWVSRHYPRPTIDPEWLSDCCDWISTEYNISPSVHFDDFITHVEAQLLQSNLEDSTVPGTGLDARVLHAGDRPFRPRTSKPAKSRPQGQSRQRKTTGPVPLLVEIRSITEIAHSAFTLLNTHQALLDRTDMGPDCDAHDQQDQRPRREDEDEGPVPRFPRGMLRFELSDGQCLFRAIEFEPIPELVLGETPLGYKMLLTSTPIRNGVAFLEPTNVTLKGYRTEDHDIHREEVFLRGLRRRLGRPDPDTGAQVKSQPPQVAPQHQHAVLQLPPARTAQTCQLAQTAAASPPSDLDDMYVDDEVVPGALHTRPKPDSTETSRSAMPAQQRTSLYFPPSSKRQETPVLVPDIGLSPVRALPSRHKGVIDVIWDSDEFEAFMTMNDSPGAETGKGTVAAKGTSSKVAPKPAASGRPTLNSKLPREAGDSPSSDPYDALSIDVDLDDEVLAQVEKAERQALGSGPRRELPSSTRRSKPPNPQGIPQDPLARSDLSRHSQTRDANGARGAPVRTRVGPSAAKSPPRTGAPTYHRKPPSSQPRTPGCTTRGSPILVISSSDSEPCGAREESVITISD